MQIKQLHALANTATQEVLGESAVLNEDLTNLVDVGNEIINTGNVDNYVKSLVNHIGKVIFVNRVYAGGAPSVLMDSWEFGSILQKVTSELPTATENQSWELQDGTNYSPDIFYQPEVSAKFFNSKVTFEIQMSFTEMQVKESFSNAEQLNGFISMLQVSVENSMTIKLDSLIMRTINNMTAEVLADELDPEADGVLDFTLSGMRAVNLLKLYNDERGQLLTKEEAMSDPDFIRYASFTISLYKDRMARISRLFNVGGKDRFTPQDQLHIVLLSDFEKASNVYLSSDVYHKDLVALPQGVETVPYWQGSGDNYSLAEISKIDVKTSTGKVVSAEGILGVMFDRNAIGIANLDRRVTTNYNPKAEFYTNFYKFDAGYYNDLNENFVVFYVG